jgi:hypothetical protein
MGALTKIRQSGFDVGLVDGYIEISPSSKLTPGQRDYLTRHKPEIIAELEAETAPHLGANPEPYPKLTDCYTPNGGLIRLMAKDAGHEEFLLRMNPKPPTVAIVATVASPKPKPPAQCGLYQNFIPHHAHGKGTGGCMAGVMPPGVCHWSETQHTCNGFKPKEQPPC